MNLFEEATKNQWRFSSRVGDLSVENLWELPLTASLNGQLNLDDIARDLHKQLKNDDNVSFVETANKSDETIQAKFDLVKHIIDVKLEKRKAVREERERAERVQRLRALIHQKKEAELADKPVEELEQLLSSLS